MTAPDAAPPSSLRVLDKGVYRGPHLYSATPMVRVTVDLGALEEWPSNRLPDFTDHLLGLLPGLHAHGCSLHRPGGFVERLRDGTWLGHVAEHVALELQTLVGMPVTRGKTRSVKGHPGQYHVMYAYEDESVGLLAGRVALALVDSLLPDGLRGVRGLDLVYRDDAEPALAASFDLDAQLDALRRLARRRTLGPTTASLVRAARRRGIPVARLDEHSLVLLGTGRFQKRLRASITGVTSHVAVEAAGNKDLTKSLLAAAGVPVPRGAVVRTADEAVREAARLRGPVVTKPLDGNHGRGVTVGLRTPEEVRAGFALAAAHSRRGRVVVEQHYEGHDHRVLVVDGRVVAVAERLPARVIGDGRRPIAALIEEVNRDPRRGDGHEQVMTKIKVDAALRALLARTGRTLESVPEEGEVVVLRDTANLSTGGTAVDRTDDIHPDNARFAERAARAVGLDVAGIDFIAPDLSRSVRETGGGIVEVNAAPGFRMHLDPSEGTARDVARPVIDMLFPRGRPVRVPIVAVTGTNGKSTTARMIAHVFAARGATVGLTSTSGVYVGGHLVATGDATGPKSARMVLRDPTVDVAVLETARGGLLREGLAFDRADVGVVTNVAADHLGLRGIDTLEDLARVKSVIVNVVRRGGTSVLNADDPRVARMTRTAGGRIAFFSLRGDDPPAALARHVEAGGLAAVREARGDEDLLVLLDGGDRHVVARTADLPATLGGLADFNVQNVLAAILACYAQGVAPAEIGAALATFTTSFEQSPGRLNVHDALPFRVIVDYAHNAAGLTALGALLGRLRPEHGRVIGMVSIPGDRRDEDILALSRVAAGLFDDLVFREAPDGRGRPAGQVMEKLTEGALSAGFPPERIHRVRREPAAVDFTLRLARPGDLVVLFPTGIEEVWRQVTAFVPEPTVPEPAEAPMEAHHD